MRFGAPRGKCRSVKRSFSVIAAVAAVTILISGNQAAAFADETSPVGASAPSALQTQDGATLKAEELLSTITVANEETSVKYDRDRFKHWIDADGNGCNTRYEVLIRDAVWANTSDNPCYLNAGEWISPYDGLHHSEWTNGLQIDHVVPLSEAWRSGAWSWDDQQREVFANDLEVPYALYAVTGQVNNSKGDRTPERWLPPLQSFQCEYVVSYTLTKYRWSLSADQVEHDGLSRLLTGTDCGSTQVTLPEIKATPAISDSTPSSEPEPTSKETQKAAPKSPKTPASGNSRLYGADRYQTAVNVSKQFPSGVEAVFVATGVSFLYALGAAAASAKLGGPLLLTSKASVPSNVLQEIRRLKPKKIFVVGGTGVISNKASSQLKSIASVKRLGGNDRYATGLQVVNSVFTGSASNAVIATGRDFPDALAASGVAGKLGAPMVLVDGKKNVVPSAGLSSLRRMKVKTITIAGGSGVVSNGIQNQLKKNGFTVKRYGGADRYQTTAAINKAYFKATDTNVVYVATGTNFPDALAGAAIAGNLKAPLFVTMPACMPDSIRSAVSSLSPRSRVALGGTAVVSNKALSGTACPKPKPKPAPAAPKPAPKPKPSTPSGYWSGPPVSPGAFCAKSVSGTYGHTKAGIKMRCKASSSDSKLRWRAA